ncbi:MAG: 1-acyl-sn-glycerol-3-phosphate acyltransferase [Anaerolineae bacterium]|nr:1-acyl-sn-glycerol-3-phosphate acyltransferase [Anaerolineae bacterium]
MAARIRIVGKENMPAKGPVILIGNHVAVIEPVLMAVYSPEQLEFLGSVDVPHEPSTQAAIDLYQMIPVFRGKPERKALKQSMEVLAQGGFLAIFPEGGLWSPGQMQAKTGVAFLSHRAQAPVLPIAFQGADGALNAILQFKRPSITMTIGKPIPPLTAAQGVDLKVEYETFASMVMDQVFSLLPEAEAARLHDLQYECFSLEIIVDRDGIRLDIPPLMDIEHRQALAMLLHRPMILKIFKVNLKLPVDAIQQLHLKPSTVALRLAVGEMVKYMKDEENGNPYLLTYRFGIQTGKEMLQGLEELYKLLDWCVNEDLEIMVQPIRRFFLQSLQKEFIQVEQGDFNHWR